jgi:iron complex outermembrane receptor protein
MDQALPHPRGRHCRTLILRFCHAWLLALLVPLAFAADAKIRFDLEIDAAERALTKFAQQSGLELIFVTELTQGIRANAVRGEFLPMEAARLLLAGTGLTIVRDDSTGLLSVERVSTSAVRPDQPRPPEKKQRRPQSPDSTLLSPTQANPAPPTDTPILLSEFRVDTSRDRGYMAATAITGTRLKMSIKQLPSALEVVTREFIDDIGAVDVKEALQYSAGIVQDQLQPSTNFLFSPSGTGQQTGALSRDSPALNIRGFNTRSLLRSGFRQDTVTDVINVDRQEIARGPQALLYGIAALGGVVNITPRYPRSVPQSTMRFGTGTDGFRRAELYQTGPLLRPRLQRGVLNYGVGLVDQEIGGPDDFDDRSRRLITPALDFQPFEQTTIFVDVEYGVFTIKGHQFKDVIDASGGTLRNTFGLRVAENVDDFNDPIGVARNRFGRDRSFRLSGGDTLVTDDYFSGTIELTQKLFTGLSVAVSANYSDKLTHRRTLDSPQVLGATTENAVRPDGIGLWTQVGPSPHDPTQTAWKTIQYQWSKARTHKYIRQARVDLNYEFSLGGYKQSLLLGRMDQNVEQANLSTTQVTSNVPGGTNRSFLAFADVREIRYRGETVRPFRDDIFLEWNTGHYAVYQGRWGKNRQGDDLVTLIGGLRWDRYMVRDLQYTFQKADLSRPDSDVSNWVRPTRYDANATSLPGQIPKVEGYRFGGKVQRESAPTIGLSVAINPDVSVYAVSAGGVFPNTGQRDGAGDPFSAEATQSKELGVKLEVWRDRHNRPRLSASAAAFRIDRANAIYNLFWAPQPRSNNQATLRAGFTANANVRGDGSSGYSVTNSAFTSFQTAQPITYLLPLSYVAPGDLNHPRVTGAPQQGGFILVDYSSLGNATSDPLRRAMDTAASDRGNVTALQTTTVGTGSDAFNANNAYMNRNADATYQDRTEGFDLQLVANLTDNLSSVLTYTYLRQGITGGVKITDQPQSTEYDSWWNFMGIPLEQRRANLNESSYDVSAGIRGARTIDNPRNALSLWTKYTIPDGRLRGVDIGVGLLYNGERQSQIRINNGGRNLSNAENQRFKPNFAADYKVNLGVGYRVRMRDRLWSLRLNINNVLNEQKSVVHGTSTLFINPADGALVSSMNPGAQRITVPERAVRYYAPISFRLVAGVEF